MNYIWKSEDESGSVQKEKFMYMMCWMNSNTVISVRIMRKPIPWKLVEIDKALDSLICKNLFYVIGRRQISIC